ncbi:MAG: OmpH family outer membrane protein, partial [Waddliaceae bacterium]
MKTLQKLIYAGAATILLCFVAPKSLEAQGEKIGLVNFKACVEKSKFGKQEQDNFEALKKQMEGVLEEKEKTLSEISTKFNDPDYLDSLSSEAEAELKHKFRSLNQELAQHQQHEHR